MASYQCTTLEPSTDFCLWQEQTFSAWLNTPRDLVPTSGLDADTGHEGPQGTNPVPFKRHLDAQAFDIPTPDLAYPSSFDSSDQQGGCLSVPWTEIDPFDCWTNLPKAPNREYIQVQDDEVQHLICSECGMAFENLQSLDKHTKATLHKGWRCQEAGCYKTYARRDTFLRHRTTHMDSGHTCKVCARSGKHKVFKRKDHLKEHLRNCHSRSVDGIKSSPNTLSFHKLTDNITSEGMSISTAPSVVECSSQQQEAMKDLVRSLGTVLGDRHPNLMEKLENKMTALSSSDMESIAEHMAGAALAAKTYLTVTKSCSCDSSSSRRDHNC